MECEALWVSNFNKVLNIVPWLFVLLSLHRMHTIYLGSRESKRDFIKENAKQIKTIQKVLGEREAGLTAREPLKVLHKSEKYEHVESKVAQEVKVSYCIVMEKRSIWQKRN